MPNDGNRTTGGTEMCVITRWLVVAREAEKGRHWTAIHLI